MKTTISLYFVIIGVIIINFSFNMIKKYNNRPIFRYNKDNNGKEVLM